MRTRAAVLTDIEQDWQILELELDEPGPTEVLVRMKVAGLCHSDKHVKIGGGVRMPMVGGHEGAGIIEQVGSAVTDLVPGDHVALSWIPSCGKCKWCRKGMGNLCNVGALMGKGELITGGFRFHKDGEDYSSTGGVGSFSERIVVSQNSTIKVDKSLPWEWVSLATCGVATGWGSVVKVGKVQAGDSVLVYGAGGIGANAVLAAVAANAGLVAVVEPVEWKREQCLKWGADAVFASAEEAHPIVWDRTDGEGVDVTIVTVGVVHSDTVEAAFNATRKGGSIVLTGVSDHFDEVSIQLSGTFLTLFQKRIIGTLFGDCTPHLDVPVLLDLAAQGKIPLDDLVTNRYALDEVEQGFTDMLEGRNFRGVIVFDD